MARDALAKALYSHLFDYVVKVGFIHLPLYFFNGPRFNHFPSQFSVRIYSHLSGAIETRIGSLDLGKNLPSPAGLEKYAVHETVHISILVLISSVAVNLGLSILLKRKS